ncbi:lamin-1 [Folsomia candida]|nr:lamin-1 [Folsomia candida]
MNQPTVGERFLRFATKTAVRILPKEAKILVRKYKKLRSGKNFRKIQETATTTQNMPPPKSSKKKVQSQGQEKVAAEVEIAAPTTPNIPAEVKEALVEEFRKMSLEGGESVGLPQESKKSDANTIPPAELISTDSKSETKNDKIRFQKYNIRLEDIIKFREKLNDIEIKQLSLPPAWSKTINEVDSRAKDEVQKARDEVVEAQINAGNLKDELDEAHALLRAANTKNEKYTREVEAQRQDYAQLQHQLSETEAKLKETYEKCDDLENQAQEKDKNLQDAKEKYVQERDAKTRVEHALKQLEADLAIQLQLKDGQLSQIIEEHTTQISTKNDEIANMIEEIRKIDANYKLALVKKANDLEAVYSRRYSEHQQQMDSVQNDVIDREKEIETLKVQLKESFERISNLEKENASLKAALDNTQKSENNLRDLITDIKRDLEKVRQSYQDANKELKDKEIKFIVEDLEPEFIKYDGLLILEEKRIQGIRQRRLVVDDNNN